MKLPTESQLPETLPALREDIIIEPGGLDFNGAPTWIIQDPVNNRFFHIGWQENEMLKYWQSISPSDFLEKISLHSLVEITETEIEKILTFLSQNCLIQQSYSAIKAIRDRAKPKKTNWFIWLAKNYLFFRIPLVKPNTFLSKSYPYVKFIFSRSFAIFMAIFALIGLILLQRQWDQFTHTFFELFSLEYILLYGVALVFAKICHELGHAYTCKKYGLTIPSMGIAFLVMFPMLYTDTTESWKIKRPSRRITVALAGVMIECYLAIFALWLWMFLPNGGLKSACFFLSTYSLLTTLIINISPFLRFDGYHVLSDILSMRNLQTRSFALTKWKIRELIFRFEIEAPEHFTTGKRRFLIAYAIATWLYRFILFIGIAIMVYYLFFKALGIILFIIEIIYFILQPIYKEIKVWWSMKSMIKRNKNTLC